MAMMGSATAGGADRARIAAEQAVASPLLEDVNLAGARGVLVNITASARPQDEGVPRGDEHDQGVHRRGRDGDRRHGDRRRDGRPAARDHGRDRPRRRRGAAQRAPKLAAVEPRSSSAPAPTTSACRSRRSTTTSSTSRRSSAARRDGRRGDAAAGVRHVGHPGVPAQAGGLSAARRTARQRGGRAGAIAACSTLSVEPRTASRRGPTWLRPHVQRSSIAMLKQRTLKNVDQARPASGLHTGAQVELVAAPGAAGHRHRVPPRRPRRAGRPSRPTRDARRRHAAVVDARAATARGLHGRAPDVGARGPRHRQPATSTSPARRSRSWTAARARSCSCCSRPASWSRTAPKRYLRVAAPVEVRDGDKWARFEPYNGFKLDFTIDFPHPVFGVGEPARRHRLRRALLREGSRARAHVRLHAGRRGDARRRARRSAAACRTRSCWTSSAC